jgi:tetratricopeptide (TPR) repeat protein
LEQPRGSRPDPSQVTDLAEFVDLLARLRLWAGNPSYRTLAKRVGPLLRPPRVLSHTTLADTFQPERRRLDLDVVLATVRALGLDELEADRWRAAWFRVHNATKTGGPVGVFRQLPADLATFTGRKHELERLMTAIEDGEASGSRTVIVSAIEGMAGVGKTQLAVHAAHDLVRAGRYADVQLFVNLRGFDAEMPPADPKAVLDGFLRQLGVAPAQIPDALDARAAMFRDRTQGRDALILLDNAADDRQVRDLIPASPTCLVLITSRRTLAGLDEAYLHLLDVFSRADALDLLARIAGPDRVASEPTAADQIIEACGHLPLAISLAASRLRSRPTWRLADFADRLRKGDLASVSIGQRSLTAVFDLSLDGLPQPLQHFFRTLGLFPGDDFAAPAAAALAEVPVDTAHQMLERLQDEYLLQQKTPRRYEFHDLLRAYARDLATADPTTPATNLSALTRLADHYRYTASVAMNSVSPTTRERRPSVTQPVTEPTEFATPTDALDWLHTERPNLLAVAAQAASHDLANHVSQLSHITWRYLHDHGHHRDALTLHTLAVTSARASGDRKALANALRLTGLTYERLGRLQEGLEALEQAQANCEDPGDLAAILEGLGNLNVLIGSYHKAAAYFDQALVLWQSQGHMQGVGNDLGNLGILSFRLGRYDAAHDYLARSLAVHEDHGFPASQAQAIIWLGIVCERTGDYARAAEHLDRALDLAHVHGLPAFESDVLEIRGKVRQAQGHSDQALADLLRSLEIRTQHTNQPNQCDSLLALGNFHLQQGETDRALDYLHKALETARDVGMPAVQSAALTGIGEALVAQGDTDSALHHHRQALELARKVRDPYQLARAHEALGLALSAAGHPAEALTHLQTAHDSYAQMRVPDAKRLEADSAFAPRSSQ